MGRPFPLLCVFTLGVLLYVLLFQGTRGLWEPDEGRYTLVASEMLRGGDWMRPILHHERPHWTKPPLTYWTIAASAKVFGNSEFAARLPNAVAFFATIMMVFLLGRIFVPRNPILPAVVHASSLLPFLASNIVTTDTLLTLWETLAMCAFAQACWDPGKGRKGGAVHLMWAAFGLAFFTKGPPGLIPLLCILLFRKLTAGEKGKVALRWATGLPLMGLIGLSWYILVIANNPGLANYFIWDEFLLRIFSSHHHRNYQWYGALTVYVPILIAGTLPWTFLLIKALYRSIKNCARHFRKGGESMDGKALFLILWFVLPLIVFSLSRSRMPLYLLPLFVPGSLLTARLMERRAIKWSGPRQAALALWCLVLLSSRILSGFWPAARDASAVAREIEKATPAQYNEIVFVDTQPYLGLGYLMNTSIEIVTLRRRGSALYPDEFQGLINELQEAEEPRLFVVPEDKIRAFSSILKEEGLIPRRQGRFEGWKRYELFRIEKE